MLFDTYGFGKNRGEKEKILRKEKFWENFQSKGMLKTIYFNWKRKKIWKKIKDSNDMEYKIKLYKELYQYWDFMTVLEKNIVDFVVKKYNQEKEIKDLMRIANQRNREKHEKGGDGGDFLTIC